MKVIIKSTSNKTTIEQTLKALKRKGKFDAFKHCGKLKLNEDPLVIQKSMRNEW